MPQARPTRPEGQVMVDDMVLSLQVSQEAKACRGRSGDTRGWCKILFGAQVYPLEKRRRSGQACPGGLQVSTSEDI